MDAPFYKNADSEESLEHANRNRTSSGTLPETDWKVVDSYALQGVIPLPAESYAEYLLRAEHLSALRREFPIDELPKGLLELIAASERCFFERFGMRPDWVPYQLRKGRCRFWERAACLIFREESGVEWPCVELPKNLRDRFFSGPPPEEVIEHELIHAVRCGLQSHYFEELIAWQASSSRWRRLCTPFFASTVEVLAWMGMVLCTGSSFFWSLFEPESAPAFFAYVFFSFILAFSLCFGVVRLALRRRTLQRVFSLLETLSGKNAEALLLAVTDQELSLWQMLSPEALSDMLKVDAGKGSLRAEWMVRQFQHG